MESVVKLQHHRHQPLSHHRQFHKPISPPFFFVRPLPLSPAPSCLLSSSPSKSKPTRASSDPPPQNHKPSSSPLLKTICVAVASAALFFMRAHHKPVLAALVAPPMVEPLPRKDSSKFDSDTISKAEPFSNDCIPMEASLGNKSSDEENSVLAVESLPSKKSADDDSNPMVERGPSNESAEVDSILKVELITKKGSAEDDHIPTVEPLPSKESAEDDSIPMVQSILGKDYDLVSKVELMPSKESAEVDSRSVVEPLPDKGLAADNSFPKVEPFPSKYSVEDDHIPVMESRANKDSGRGNSISMVELEPLASKKSAEDNSIPKKQPLTSKESAEEESIERKEQTLEDHLSQHPNDIEALRSLLEVRFKARKFKQSVEVIERLIQLEPQKFEWPRMKMFANILVVVASNTGNKLHNVLEVVERTMERCNRERWRDWNERDFKILIAHIRVVEGNYTEALKIYQQLVKDEPMDFRPYLCRVLIYTLLRKDSEARKEVEKFNKLVLRTRPYEEFYSGSTLPINVLVSESFFHDNMLVTHYLFKEIENERFGLNSLIGRLLR